MEFELSAEREQLRAAVRRCVESLADEAQIRQVMESASGFDPQLWGALSKDLQVVGLRVPDPVTGAVASFADVAAVLTELGRGPVCSPYLSTAVLVPEVLRLCGSAPALQLLGQHAGGDLLSCVSLERTVPDSSVIGERRGEEILLTGTDPFVLDAAGAELLVIPAMLAGEPAILAVRGDAAGLSRQALTTMDQTRRAARLDFHDTPAEVLAGGDQAVEALRTARHIARVALACEQVGGTARCLELAVDYAKNRKQFGVAIGSFQAVKHRCANMLAALTLAQTAAEYAAWCVDSEPQELPVAALLAGSLCSQTYLDVAAGTIQVHGGIGFTWDNPAHLFFKRAKSGALMFGQPVAQRAELAPLIGL